MSPMTALVHAAQYLRYARESVARSRRPVRAEDRGESLRMAMTWLRLSEAALDQASLDADAPRARRAGRSARHLPQAGV